MSNSLAKHSFERPSVPTSLPISDAKQLVELVKLIVKAIVDNSDAATVTSCSGDRTLVIKVSVAKEDIGKVIGKKGKTAHAIRTILNCSANKLKGRAILEIVE